ncbi:MAG: hypothetical protein GX878_08310 [Firmicutes bacterium]|nr:hypothetical protein [Bacillota bacterium]
MKEKNISEELEKERKKFGELTKKAREKGIPLSQDEAVLAQSRKIDALIMKFLKLDKNRE